MIGQIRNAAFSTSAKRAALAVAVFCITTAFCAAQVCCAATLDISAPSAILVEAHTGQVLFEKDADTPRPPASMTKIATMLLVMEALDRGQISLDDVVTASENAARMGGTQIWLASGEQMNVDDLLKSVAIASANDAAVALGEHVSGAEEVFVGLMNAPRRAGCNQHALREPTVAPAAAVVLRISLQPETLRSCRWSCSSIPQFWTTHRSGSTRSEAATLSSTTPIAL